MPTQNINFQDPEKYFLTEKMKEGSIKVICDDVGGTYFNIQEWKVTLEDIKEVEIDEMWHFTRSKKTKNKA